MRFDLLTNSCRRELAFVVGSEETDVTMNSMTRYLAVLSLLIGCLFARVALGQQRTTTRVVDIRASDGSVLKATYFAAANTGPGVLLLHQCNRFQIARTPRHVVTRFATALNKNSSNWATELNRSCTDHRDQPIPAFSHRLSAHEMTR